MKTGKGALILLLAGVIALIAHLGYGEYRESKIEETVIDMHNFFNKELAKEYGLRAIPEFKLALTHVRVRTGDKGVDWTTYGELFCYTRVISIAITDNLEEVMNTVAHEHVHAIQVVESGGCHSGSIEWKLPYHWRIWEIQARLRAPDMVKKYLKYKESQE